MDAGVPLESPVAGIAMGLIKEGEKFAVLSDILGAEDHLGDMDFKVAGTDKGITALQMDLKITSVSQSIMEIALEQARVGRLHILGKMAEALDVAREEVREYAPRMITFVIPKDKIREVIGTGGKVIRDICETTGAKIDITDDGTINVSGPNAEAIEAAEKRIRGITDEPEVGVIYKGKVVRIVDFGAFVSFFGSQDGLVHISELAPRRVEKVEDIVKVGDEIFVKVLEMDNRGKIRLSMKRVDQKTGHEISSNANSVEAEA
jgi:polyribonucleotide nucleotidyltransferase